MGYFVQIRKIEGGEVVKEIAAGTYEGRAERILRGASINLNHDQYYLVIDERESGNA